MSDSDEVLKNFSVQSDENKVKEYFNCKSTIRNLTADIKAYRENHANRKEIETLAKKLKRLRDEVAEDIIIKEVTEKVKQLKERKDLMKEMLRIEMIENSQEEIESTDFDRKLILRYDVKEAKKDEKGSKKFTPHSDQTSFN